MVLEAVALGRAMQPNVSIYGRPSEQHGAPVGQIRRRVSFKPTKEKFATNVKYFADSCVILKDAPSPRPKLTRSLKTHPRPRRPQHRHLRDAGTRSPKNVRKFESSKVQFSSPNQSP